VEQPSRHHRSAVFGALSENTHSSLYLSLFSLVSPSLFLSRGWLTETEKMLEVMAVDNERRGIRKC